MLKIQSLDKVITNLVFALQILLLFLLLFESKVSIPVWLQPVGRMHPLLLHFPIGLIILLGLFQLVKKEIDPVSFDKIQRFTLYIAALTTSMSALMGLFLSLESGYASTLLTWHKWAGVLVSFLTYALLVFAKDRKRFAWGFNGSLIAALVVLVFAGHFGASLTHGEDFVWAPLQSTEPTITEESPLFEAAIVPILEEKCVSCHNPRKRKGELDMSSLSALQKGGEHGAIWEAGDSESSLMVQRIYLPLSEEEHMPPEGKPQLTTLEQQLLSTWIEQGANATQALNTFEPSDTLYALATNYLETRGKEITTEKEYPFEFASNKTLSSLNNSFRKVSPLTANSPALQAQLFVRQAFEPQSLEELAQVKEQLVHLNLTDMPLTDEEVPTLARFLHLEKLILNGTEITGEKLGTLKACEQLTSLSISSTQVGPEIATTLADLPALEELVAWNTQLTPIDFTRLRQEYPHITFHEGFIPDKSELLKLSPPQLDNPQKILDTEGQVTLRHSINGSVIRYTIDGTDPDSLNSPVYTDPIPVDSYLVLKARAFKSEWLGSDLLVQTFFRSGLPIDTAFLNTAPHDDYPGRGVNTLFDGQKGKAGSFRSSPMWLGYRGQPFDMDVYLPNREVSHVTLSYALNTGAYIMPPLWVEVWGGDNRNQMRKLERVVIDQPIKSQRNRVEGVNIDIPNSTYSWYKIVAQPVMRLPSWHRGSGDKGWVFIDEVFFNGP